MDGKETTLYIGNRHGAVQYFAHEADRFASAAFESILVGVKNPTFPRSTGWLLIRAYYAAFFAMHSLMRLHGWACVRLSSANLKAINKDVALFFSGSGSLNAGLYFVKSNDGARELICSPLDTSATHDALWSVARDFFNEIGSVVLQGNNAEGQALVALLDKLQRLAEPFGGTKWFSTLRNRINYAHEYGTWFPYLTSTSDYDRVDAALGVWKGMPEDAFAHQSDDELIGFATACGFIVSLCCTTVRDLTFRSRSNSPFRGSSGRLV
ncbi:hypothetical protein [Variovorax rhizosphaerae]|uniref:Uncharacterized protein n=1 Tax=Variovorax rhizosphaerae TaxID=1836200 RepID=A0ABU8WS33_9BURK